MGLTRNCFPLDSSKSVHQPISLVCTINSFQSFVLLILAIAIADADNRGVKT